ncbi:helix-turn-helix domain-containing protein [Dactylosporangium maewongense]|uniref:helix-turn-helix domain-containing protein n=1 Tax=Dactylosporangium maewongense TaxID=634393 RepID=UPI003CD05A41
MRAKMIAASWDGERTSGIAARLGCHIQTVRKRLARFNAEGIDGLGDLPGAGRKRRISEHERGRIIALARSVAPGRPRRRRGDQTVRRKDRRVAATEGAGRPAAACRAGRPGRLPAPQGGRRPADPDLAA